MAANTRSGLSFSLCIARIMSILQFFRNWLDCKRLCVVLSCCNFVGCQEIVFCCDPKQCLVLVQYQTIGRCWHNLTKSYIDCKYSWILTQSTWIVSKLRHCVGMDGLSAHVWGSHWGPPSPRCFFFCEYRQSPSRLPGCRCNFTDCGGHGMRMQTLNAIEVNWSRLYLNYKLSTIEPRSCGSQKMRSTIATGF